MNQTILLTLALALFAAAPAFAAVGSDEDVAKGIAVVVHAFCRHVAWRTGPYRHLTFDC